jgi:hypothetical protein
MANIGAVTRQIAALEISAKQNGATKQSRSLQHQKTASQSSQSNVSKLLTKFAAPNPFPDPKSKAKTATVRTRPANPTHSTAAKQPQPAPAKQAKPSSGREIDIGKYDGGFEIENEKRGEAVEGEAAQDLALDSSVSRLVCPHYLRPNYSPVPPQEHAPRENGTLPTLTSAALLAKVNLVGFTWSAPRSSQNTSSP